MKLSIKDRIMLPQLCPEFGSYEVLKGFKDLLPLIKFTEEEMRKFDISQGFPTTVRCMDCGNEFVSLEPPNAINGTHICVACQSANTKIVSVDTSRQQITFNEEVAGASEKEIKIPVAIASHIRSRLAEMSEAGQLSSNFLRLYEVFVLNK